ncbi:hypothetical protein BEL04_14015 [Mucilaginibacter sp. PPCGB 2223]|uniref:FecR family protein n=1 Tax=Mucilaginibacter sp. PPCGB 2223 TaxID=1886027 RepID=UPI000826766D|nr:FecR family protein [Mucilaginibacter sp. PPCGB 2223]OCX52564.1 hypothetical protein BEL04_14015 [Mucilaginibacter sp. PPCGB 2223]
MDQDRFKILTKKYLEGNATHQEIKTLYQWFDSFDDSTIHIDNDEKEVEDDLRSKIYLTLAFDKAQPKVVALKKKPSNTWRYAAAAILLLAIGIVATLFVRLTLFKGDNTELVKAVKFKPVGNKATLTLSNGKVIELDGAQAKQVRDSQGRLVAVNINKELSYRAGSAAQTGQVSETNTLTTPRGGQYKIVLPDGTAVWLNAASSITYPIAFDAKERRVQINGEAYFEVTKDPSKPFRVVSTKQVVEVLGTHFDVNAYSDEPTTNTTLIEGKVKVTAAQNQALLIPGDQAQLSASGLVIDKSADTEEATAWKNGYFVFNHEHIESIMRKISRWYDVEVAYEGPISKDWFGGSISREKNAAELLGKLELTGQIHFKIEGRRVIVMQ